MWKYILLFLMAISYRADAQNVSLTVSGPAGNLYVNEIYTGRQAPATISVPMGNTRIGIGNSSGYFQKTINLASNTTIDLNNLHPVPRRSFRMVIVVPRWTSHGGEMAYLEDSDLVMAEVTARRASAEDVLPSTYGMLDWDIDVFPIVENTTLNRGGNPENWPDAGVYLREAGLSYLADQYDAVLLFYSVFRPDGSVVENRPCCLWGSRGYMAITNGSRHTFRNQPQRFIGEGYTHEWLHGIEQTSGIYVEGYLHGAEAHGYTATTHGSHDWRGWYWDFMKGLVPRIPGTPEVTDYVGHFSFLKNYQRDRWKDSEVILDAGLPDGVYTISAVHSSKALSLKAGNDTLIQNPYRGNRDQQWQLRNLGNGNYRITSLETGMTMALSEGKTFNGISLVQQRYTGERAQQWHIFPEGNNQYRIASRHTGRAMDVYGVSQADGARVVQWDYLGGNNQKWIFTPVEAQPFDGVGLSGEYFNGMNFQERVLERTDSQISFNWQTGSPAPQVQNDQFSVRWSGQIEPAYSGEYTFYINSDNGRRLWINGELIIDGWIDNWDVEYKGNSTLQAREKYDIVLEYFEHQGGANITLEWESPGQDREVIPQQHLYPASVVTSAWVASDVFVSEPYPNPAVGGGQVRMQFPAFSAPVSFSLYSFDGKIMQTGSLNGNENLLISAPEQAGVYFIHLNTGGEPVVRKLIVR